jgi:hypothetical protein
MTPPPGADRPLSPETGGRRGRKPAPISETAGPSHRAWLEPVRDVVFSSSGPTLDDLVYRSGYSKTRISELLRGNGYYPAWEITSSVIRALGLPVLPMRRLWTAAAREARKEPFWWQYAAGAGHGPAAYCLSLHHRARGEAHAAAFWYDQTGLPTETEHDTIPRRRRPAAPELHLRRIRPDRPAHPEPTDHPGRAPSAAPRRCHHQLCRARRHRRVQPVPGGRDPGAGATFRRPGPLSAHLHPALGKP